MSDPLTGTAFGHYRVETLLGGGGMGRVYRAVDTRLGRTVALKLLDRERRDGPNVRERFLREGRLLASLAHANIVTVYEADEWHGEPYLATQLIDGPDLQQLLTREGPLEPSRAVGLLAQIADALDAAHAAGLVHRDVKPANILVIPAPEPRSPGHAYLTDFGLTKPVEPTASALTMSGHFVGTPGYVAPEQVEGKAVDHRADVYALGCVLYDCLTGSVPFPRASTVAALWAHVQDPPPRPSTVRVGLSAFDGVIATALAKAPAERYQTAGALAGAARNALSVSSATTPAQAPATGAGAAGVVAEAPAPGAAHVPPLPPAQPTLDDVVPGLPRPELETSTPPTERPPGWRTGLARLGRLRTTLVAGAAVVAVGLALTAAVALGLFARANAAPVSLPQGATVQEDTPIEITLQASDSDGDALAYEIVRPPEHGTLSGGSGAGRTYTPASDYSGQDSFDFRVSDGQLQATANISILVLAVNDVPAVTAATWAGAKEGQECALADCVWAVFADPDGQPATDYSAEIDWGDGTTSAGVITYDAEKGRFSVAAARAYQRFGTYTISVKVTDSHGGSGSGALTAPIADADLTGAPFTTAGTSRRNIKWGPFIVGCVDDANPYGVPGDITAEVAWGDGGTSKATIRAWASGDADTCVEGWDFVAVASHTYSKTGTFAYTVTYTSRGGSSATSSGSVVVR